MRVLFIADIHFGATNFPDIMYRNLAEVFFTYLEENLEYIDLIVVGGDDTDMRISLNMNAAKYYLMFVNRICSYRKANGFPLPVRFINGTDSHQKNQLNSLSYLTTNPMLNVRIIERVLVENFNGCDIIYVPEEYILSKEEYYNDTLYSGRKYELGFGHGMFNFISAGYGTYEEAPTKNSPIFTYEDFANCVYGPVAFGHIHKYTNYSNKVYYSGSFDRFCHGEEQPKGFLDISYEDKSKKYTVDFIENYLAAQFVTLTITPTLSAMSVDTLVDYIYAFKSNNTVDELRVMVHEEIIDPTKSKILENHFRMNKDLGIRVEVERNVIMNQPTINDKSLLNRYNEMIKANDFYGNTVNYAKEKYEMDICNSEISVLLDESKQLR